MTDTPESDIPQAAVKAALDAYKLYPYASSGYPTAMRRALCAALPHLLPKPVDPPEGQTVRLAVVRDADGNIHIENTVHYKSDADAMKEAEWDLSHVVSRHYVTFVLPLFLKPNEITATVEDVNDD